MQIRIATQTDLQHIVAIYNQAIADRNCTADTEPLTVTGRQEWFDNHDPQRYPIFVIEENPAAPIIGWCSLSAHRKGRIALQNVAEISYYIDRTHRGKGFGKGIIQHALLAAPALGLHNLFAILLDTNRTSVALLTKHGFSQWGHLPDIAEFEDSICGQYIFGRKV